MVANDTLGVRSVRALKWSYLGVSLRALLQLGAGVLLARLLGPQAFGSFAVVVLVIGILNLLTELGLGAALTQKPEIDAYDVRYAFTWVSLAGLVSAGFLAIGAVALAALYGQPDLTPLLRAAAVPVVLQALGVVSMSLLRRQLDHKTIQVHQFASYVLGYLGVGVTMAWSGFGAWSLLGALSAQTLLQTVGLYACVRHPVVPLFRHPRANPHTFGSRAVGSNIVNWLIENFDNVLVGKIFGVAALGAYAVAYSLVRTPVNQLVAAMQSVLFASVARAQDDQEVLGRVYVGGMGLLALGLMPPFFGLAAVAPTAIEALYGASWQGAGGLLAPLAIAMPLHALMAVSGPILWGKGLVGRELRVQVMVALIFAVVLIVTAGVSLSALAWGVLLVYGIRAAWMMRAVLDATGASARRLGASLRGGVLVGGGVAVLLAGSDRWMAEAGWAAVIRLPVEVGLGGVLLLVVMTGLRSTFSTADMAWLVERAMRKSLPQPAALRVSTEPRGSCG